MESKKLYVRGLPFSTTDHQLEEMFSLHGTVESARVIVDKFSGKSRGFGFVEMSSQNEAQRAIQVLNEREFEGRNLTVGQARSQERRSGGFPEDRQRNAGSRSRRVMSIGA